jgi:hypothetical protein
MASALARPVPADEPRAIAMLKADHRVFDRLFDEFEKASGKRKLEIAQELCLRITVHSKVEEEVFYPALSGKVDQDQIDEAVVEHQAAETIIRELEEMDGSEDLYDAKFHVLGEQLRHHIEEEETEMFEEAKQAGLDLEEIGARMQSKQDELLREVQAKGALEEE